MREVLGQVSRWYADGTPYAIATVVGVRGSAPREPGATMAVSADGEVVGSVSGGCVEGAVYEAAGEVLATSTPTVQTYGISDDDAFAVGLTCGGVIDVLVQPVDGDRPAALGAVLASIERNEPVAVATVVGGPAPLGASLAVWPERTAGSLGVEGLDVAVTDDARGLLAQGMTATRHYGPRGERRLDDVAVFVQSFTPPPRMLVFGAIDFAAAVARVGAFLGYHVTVCDARPVFATAKRFPDAHEVVCEWPHRYLARTTVDERTVICVLTHDPKFDVPLLEVALRRPAAYIGAMGSRRTHEDRLRRLREVGVTAAQLARLCSPVGLDLGARTPEETAVSIAAEIVQLRWRGTGRRLSESSGRIHGHDTHGHDRDEEPNAVVR
jgi:xanthine dehydrogenase accessory factor